MPNGDESENGVLALIKKIGGWVSSISGLIAGLVGLVKVVVGDARLVFYMLLYGGALLLWVGCFIIYFVKMKKPRIPLILGGYDIVFVFSRKMRRAAYASIFAVPLIAALAFGISTYIKSRPPDKTIVLVANFQRLDPQASGTSEKLLEHLRDATEKYRSDIEVTPLKREITAEDGSEAADTAGRERKASIVIWGFYNREFITAHFRVMMANPTYLAMSKSNILLDLYIPPDQRTVKVQVGLSNGITYLTLFTVGLARFDAQDFEGAIRMLSDALAQANAPETQLGEADKALNLAVAYYYLGRSFASQSRHREAIVNFLEAINRKPDFEAAHLHLAYAYQVLGKQEAEGEFNRAIELYTRIIETNPRDVNALLNRGSAYVNLRKFDEALGDYNRAIELQPDNAYAYNNRGIVYYKRWDTSKGDPDKAFTDFNHAIRLTPADPTGYNNRGSTFSKKGQFASSPTDDFDMALADYDMVIRLAPKRSSSYLNRAFVYYDKYDYEKAVADYNRAIELDPKNFRAYRNRGWANLFLAHSTAAAQDAKKFLDLRGECTRDDQYVALLGYLGSREAQNRQDAEQFLNRVAENCGELWPTEIVRYFRHEIDARQLLATASATPEDDRNERLTEAQAYVGMDMLLSGRRDEAMGYLRWVTDNGDREADEYHLALAEMKRLAAH